MSSPEISAHAGPLRPSESTSLAYLALVLGLILTLALWHYSETTFHQRAQDRFAYRVDKEKLTLLNRIQAYEQVLRGGRALFAASDDVTVDEWRQYVALLALDQTLPGIQGTGFTLMVPRSSLASHVTQIRTTGFPGYDIHPAGDRELYSSILYLEPFDARNQRAFGYDMYAEPIRREAMERARDTGNPALSAKVTLVQETGKDVQPGFLIYLAVYRNGAPTDTVAQRRAALVGFVYSPFRAHDLMRGIFAEVDQDVNLEVYDDAVAPENLLFSSQAQVRDARYTLESPMEISGRRWVLRFHSREQYEEATRTIQPQILLTAGTLLNVLLFTVMYTSARHRRRMRIAAAALTDSLARYQTLVENVPGTVFRCEPGIPWRFIHVSAGVETLTGFAAGSFIRGEQTFGKLIQQEDLEHVQEVLAAAFAARTAYEVEYRIRTRTGETKWVSERGRASYDDQGNPTFIDGVILDSTEQKLAENAIRDLAFYDPLTALPNRRLLYDRLHQAIASSARSRQHGAVLFIDLDKFKALNDSAGHEAGDALLKAIARRLTETVRQDDTVARLGGDEFVVILENLGNAADAATKMAYTIANKLREALSAPYTLGELTHQTTPSIGIATFCGSAREPNQLIRDADTAMYRAKSSGQGCICVHADTHEA